METLDYIYSNESQAAPPDFGDCKQGRKMDGKKGLIAVIQTTHYQNHMTRSQCEVNT